jgi:hypothetical protein
MSIAGERSAECGRPNFETARGQRCDGRNQRFGTRPLKIFVRSGSKAELASRQNAARAEVAAKGQPPQAGGRTRIQAAAGAQPSWSRRQDHHRSRLHQLLRRRDGLEAAGSGQYRPAPGQSDVRPEFEQRVGAIFSWCSARFAPRPFSREAPLLACRKMKWRFSSVSSTPTAN